jgi:hypothetical protein
VKLRRTSPEESPSELSAATDTEVADRPVKGRPTPKRRDAAPRRQPVSAPRTSKEASQWRKQQAATPARAGGPAKMTNQELRAARMRGEESALARKDRGPARKYARDWVDTRRMASNYLLILFPLYLASLLMPLLTAVAAAMLLILIAECAFAARRIKREIDQRFGKTRETALGLTFYVLGRAYLPRRWRIPKPTHEIGDKI